MSEDEALDSDSSGRVFHKSMARRRSRRAKGARVCYSPKTVMSLQDPMPEYVDPELVKLIAQNAPFELDVFVRSLQQSSPKRLVENGRRRREAVQEGERKPLAVDAILSSVAERNYHLSARKGGQDVRHSCPERMWSDYYEKEESVCRAKRKRSKGFDIDRPPHTDGPRRSQGSLRMSDNCRRGSREAFRESQVTSGESSDDGAKSLEDEFLAPQGYDAGGLSSAPAEQPVDNGCDKLNSKPWRHGMRKGTRTAKDEKLPDPICCKRKAEVDSRKTTAVRKYMETKVLERRKEQQQLKAEADAALSARKEQQRKLDLHRQTMLQS